MKVRVGHCHVTGSAAAAQSVKVTSGVTRAVWPLVRANALADAHAAIEGAADYYYVTRRTRGLEVFKGADCLCCFANT